MISGFVLYCRYCRSLFSYRSCLFPPLSSHLVQKREEPASVSLNDQQRKKEDQRCLLEEVRCFHQFLKNIICWFNKETKV